MLWLQFFPKWGIHTANNAVVRRHWGGIVPSTTSRTGDRTTVPVLFGVVIIIFLNLINFVNFNARFMFLVLFSITESFNKAHHAGPSPCQDFHFLVHLIAFKVIQVERHNHQIGRFYDPVPRVVISFQNSNAFLEQVFNWQQERTWNYPSLEQSISWSNCPCSQFLNSNLIALQSAFQVQRFYPH